MPTRNGKVVVFGSINMDITARVERAPLPGETVLGKSLLRNGGGKGANQAVAACRAGGVSTYLIGALGNDHAGIELRESLSNFGIDTRFVAAVEGPSGTALINVAANGENSIVVIAGANNHVGPPSGGACGVLAQADVVLAQLEVPIASVTAAARARGSQTVFILNAAPSAPLPPELWNEIDILVVNEHEAVDMAAHLRTLRGTQVRSDNQEPLQTPTQCVAYLLTEVPSVLLTLGASGSVLLQRDLAPIKQQAVAVTAIDTTAAGDTFCGAFAAALADNQPVEIALALASGAAALAVQRPGAQSSVPTLDEVNRFVDEVLTGPVQTIGNHA